MRLDPSMSPGHLDDIRVDDDLGMSRSSPSGSVCDDHSAWLPLSLYALLVLSVGARATVSSAVELQRSKQLGVLFQRHSMSNLGLKTSTSQGLAVVLLSSYTLIA